MSKIQFDRVIERVYGQFLQGWFSNVQNSVKLTTYSTYKHVFEFEKYLNCVPNLKHMTALSCFRCSAHKLNIEEGRYRNIDRQDRLCTKCNMSTVENEYHFALVCPFYRDLRLQCLPKYYCTWPSYQKFKTFNFIETIGFTF